MFLTPESDLMQIVNDLKFFFIQKNKIQKNTFLVFYLVLGLNFEYFHQK